MQPSDIEVTVIKDGKQVREPLNINGPQSDGSIWNLPKPLTDASHKHYFKLKSPDSREAVCACGMGGYIYPHNANILDGVVTRR